MRRASHPGYAVWIFAFICVFSFAPAQTVFARMELRLAQMSAWSSDYNDDGSSDGERIEVFESGPSIDVHFEARVETVRTTLDGRLLTGTDLMEATFAADHRVEPPASRDRTQVSSGAGTLFWIDTTEDILVTIDAVLRAAPATETSGAGVVLRIYNSNQDLIHMRGVGLGLESAEPVASLADEIMLAGGTNYFVSAYSELRSYAARDAGPASTASSDVTLRIATVPEPATFFLTFLGGAYVSRRYRRRNRRAVGDAAS